MPAVIPKISFPIPSNEKGQAFADSDALLDALVKESSGQYLVGSQGMWHGGIHITDATAPWCALSGNTEAEQQYRSEPYKGPQFIRCMAYGDIVAYRVDKEYPSIPWRDENLSLSTSFVLVRHYVQPGENETSGLTFYTLYMNLAPFAAYAQQGDERERKTTDRLSYYRSAEDVQTGSSAKAGTLPVGVRVTLGDKQVACDSPRGRRQFGEVTVVEEVKDVAGVTLSAGTTVWILTDRGNLKAGSSASSSPPSWWAKCAPAYSTRPAGVVDCKTKRGWKYYLSSDDVLQDKKEGELTADFPLSYEPGNATQQVVRPGDNRTFSLMTLGKDVGKQKKGDRVWVVSDGDSLTALTPAGSSEPKFGEVVLASPGVKINAGDSIGHMGFYQLPEENGKRSRYQVHIECLSMDDKLPTFLTNPDKVGELAPSYLKYPEGAALFIKNAQGAMVDSTRKTRAPGIITLSKVPPDGQPTHYQIHAEGGYLAAASIQKLSQYALGELGFVTLDKAPESFDLIDGVKHPDNVVKGILEQMYKAAEAETRTSHRLNKYNYQRLLDKIDNNQDGHYSEQEYLQAIHNDSPSYRDALYRIIAKHGSEWYYGKDDPLWKNYLDTLTIDAPLWKTYTETFIEKITWMKQVAGMGPAPWHLHPVVFLGAFNVEDGVTYAQLKRIFPQASDSDINTVVSELRGKLKTFKLDTPTRLRHFFSQIKGEVGDKMKGETENFQFSPDTLRSFSRYYRQHSAEADQDGYERNSAGRTTRRADEQAIGRKHYLRLNGNRQSNPDDGYNFRGRGLIQITGYEKYNGFFTEYHNYWSGNVPDVVNQPEKINEMPYAIHSALWYWIKYKPYNADTGRGYDDVADVTKIVNGADMGLAKRREAYRLCEQVFL